jgi:hypothetical protein
VRLLRRRGRYATGRHAHGTERPLPAQVGKPPLLLSRARSASRSGRKSAASRAARESGLRDDRSLATMASMRGPSRVLFDKLMRRVRGGVECIGDDAVRRAYERQLPFYPPGHAAGGAGVIGRRTRSGNVPTLLRGVAKREGLLFKRIPYRPGPGIHKRVPRIALTVKNATYNAYKARPVESDAFAAGNEVKSAVNWAYWQ